MKVVVVFCVSFLLGSLAAQFAAPSNGPTSSSAAKLNDTDLNEVFAGDPTSSSAATLNDPDLNEVLTGDPTSSSAATLNDLDLKGAVDYDDQVSGVYSVTDYAVPISSSIPTSIETVNAPDGKLQAITPEADNAPDGKLQAPKSETDNAPDGKLQVIMPPTGADRYSHRSVLVSKLDGSQAFELLRSETAHVVAQSLIPYLLVLAVIAAVGALIYIVYLTQ